MQAAPPRDISCYDEHRWPASQLESKEWIVTHDTRLFLGAAVLVDIDAAICARHFLSVENTLKLLARRQGPLPTSCPPETVPTHIPSRITPT
jgi:hypothetical protein